MRFPDVETILKIHYQLVEMFIDDDDSISPPGPKNESLLHSAASRPHTGMGGEDKYNTVEAKTAALFHSLIHNHPFHNGNKRTALVSMLVSLDMNSRRLEASDDNLFEFVVSVASHNHPFDGTSDDVVDNIAGWIRRNSVSRKYAPSSMKVTDFLEKCAVAGCRVRLSDDGRNRLVQSANTPKIIKFGVQNKKLTGQVVKRYLRDLGLSEARTGIYLDEFQEGDITQQELMIQYRTVLKRLAHA
ncbi:type II toxin-antitoxin system death-on-curing family toxin [Paenibacillus sp. YN15]|uniref:type II toxin-antitoxin system death-on-curing family toxin n=1 Tax=Paenibacillus sp. YN15 TaxID=1742774 RepID=UPI000DCF564E|nr:type II toxin-antitoxin system death-on-curing family toxin [Paenibacillus sp. YN15]RAV00172.1 hypothetical protein DQG13_14550 [Paenibacillus sp. YN15]